MGCAFSKSITSSHEEESSITHTEDFWYEILLRLPLDSIFKFRCVSKVWSSILSSPNFINKWYKLNYLSLPWVLLHFTDSVEDDSPNDDDNNNKLRRKFTITHPDSHSQFVSQHQNGFSFSFLIPNLPTRSNDDQGWKGIVLIGSSNGLVLCHTKLHNQKYFFVCNPLTQKWISLPPPPTQNSWLVTGFVCNNECFSSLLVSASYKVIHIPRFEAAAKDFKVEVFCSDLGQWNIFHVLCDQDVTWVFSLHDNFVTHNGVFYWFQKMKRIILAVSVNGKTNNGTSGNHCRLINLPDRAMDSDIKLSHRLGESQGLVCCAIVKERERSLSVWVLEEDDWCLLYRDDKFHDVLAEMESLLTGEIGKIDLITGIQILGFNPVDKNVVTLGYEKYIWAYNTKTKGHEQLSRPSFLRTNGSVSQLSFLTFALTARPSVLPPVSW